MKPRLDYGQNTNSWYSSLDKELGSIAIILREIIYESVPEVKEAMKWGTPVFENKGIICALRAGKGFVALQFYEVGSSLNDPDSILEGTGKKMRHVKIRNQNDLKKELFASWIKQAAKK